MGLSQTHGSVLQQLEPQKAGLRCEGTLREHVTKAGRYEDIVVYGLLRHDFGG